MSTGSNIEWTDATWVVTTGCTEASSGCANCYARVMSKRIAGMAAADRVKGKEPGRKAAYSLSVLDDGRWSGIVTPVPEAIREPFRWRTPRRIFVNSMSDLFWGTEKDMADASRRAKGRRVPQPVPWPFIREVFETILNNPRHVFQILTKRPERMAEMERQTGLPWPSNAWAGTSVENQATADERIPHLKRCPAAVRFLSCEPLLGPIELNLRSVLLGNRGGMVNVDGQIGRLPGIDWVIVGGESGPGARPCDVAWVRSIVEQCRAAGVPCFVKQLGAKPVDLRIATFVSVEEMQPPHLNVNGRRKLTDKKGGAMEEWPTDLRVREMP